MNTGPVLTEKALLPESVKWSRSGRDGEENRKGQTGDEVRSKRKLRICYKVCEGKRKHSQEQKELGANQIPDPNREKGKNIHRLKF